MAFPRLPFAQASDHLASGRLPKDFVLDDMPLGQDSVAHHSKDTVCFNVVIYFCDVRTPQ